ncbi:MAG: DnaD domain protein [Clostridiales bacterium]|nr:DnaD domain protein [Clostridiales bacterium]
MSSIILQSNFVPNGTFIPNIFIDKYMPAANGAYVKVYLYLLRCMNDNSIKEINITTIADHLENTESDIERALCYWEKVKLVSLTRNNNRISSIILNDIFTVDKNEYSQEESLATLDPVSSATDSVSSNNLDYPQESSVLEPLNDDKAIDHQFVKPTYSDAQIKQLTSTDEVKWMLNIIELYLQRLIKPMDLQLILYLYESLDFSPELILYLYEYCVSKNKTHPSYVEAVALAWAKEGIDSLEKAEAATVFFNENYNAVKKAFGLDRALGHVEKQYVTKWTKDYELPIDIIVEACNRTLLTIQKPDFKYTDKILENWHKNKVTNLREVNNLDEEHAKKVSKSKKPIDNIKQDNNRFNAFPQRTYSKEDYSSLEQKLLHKR